MGFGSLCSGSPAFEPAYQPVPILPPDQYLSLVLQATEGCQYNRCTFCHFYRGRPFRSKHAAAFRSSIGTLQSFLGAGLPLRPTIFLADANALVTPMARLTPLFAAINEALEIAPAHLSADALTRWKAEHPLGIRETDL